MLGRKERSQLELFISGSLKQLIPDDHVLARFDRILDLAWLRDEVADCYCLDDGRPGIRSGNGSFNARGLAEWGARSRAPLRRSDRSGIA